MVTITPSDAVTLVRKNLDEQEINASAMYSTGSPDTTDNDSLDNIIKKTLPEAINAVHLKAPHDLLEGTDATLTGVTISNNIVTFTAGAPMLRLVSFKAVDSDVVLGEWTPEYSPKGREQLNQYIRGTYDDPTLVKLEGKDQYRYYTIKSSTAETYELNPAGTISECKFVPQHSYSAGAVSYTVSSLLKDAAIKHLTGMVLAIYGDQKAQYFFESE